MKKTGAHIKTRDCIMLFLDNVLSLFCCAFFVVVAWNKNTIKTQPDENESLKNNVLSSNTEKKNLLSNSMEYVDTLFQSKLS